MTQSHFDFLQRDWPDLFRTATDVETRLHGRDFRAALIEAGRFNEGFVSELYKIKQWPRPQSDTGKPITFFDKLTTDPFKALPPGIQTACHAIRKLRNQKSHWMMGDGAPPGEMAGDVVSVLRHMHTLASFLIETTTQAPPLPTPLFTAPPPALPETLPIVPDLVAVPAAALDTAAVSDVEALFDRLLAERTTQWPAKPVELTAGGATSLAAALHSLEPGGRIRLSAGAYDLPEVIDRPVEITGAGDDKVSLLLAPERLLILAANVTFEGVTLQARGTSHCHVIGGRLRIRHAVVEVPLAVFGHDAVLDLQKVACRRVGLVADDGARLEMAGGSTIHGAPQDAISLYGGASAHLSGGSITASHGAVLCVRDGVALVEETRIGGNGMLAIAGAGGEAIFRRCRLPRGSDEEIDEARSGSVQLVEVNVTPA
jgi:hypothetical protein